MKTSFDCLGLPWVNKCNRLHLYSNVVRELYFGRLKTFQTSVLSVIYKSLQHFAYQNMDDVNTDLLSAERPQSKSPPEDSITEYGPGSAVVSGDTCCGSPTLLSLQTLLVHGLAGSDLVFTGGTER